MVPPAAEQPGGASNEVLEASGVTR